LRSISGPASDRTAVELLCDYLGERGLGRGRLPRRHRGQRLAARSARLDPTASCCSRRGAAPTNSPILGGRTSYRARPLLLGRASGSASAAFAQSALTPLLLDHAQARRDHSSGDSASTSRISSSASGLSVPSSINPAPGEPPAVVLLAAPAPGSPRALPASLLSSRTSARAARDDPLGRGACAIPGTVGSGPHRRRRAPRAARGSFPSEHAKRDRSPTACQPSTSGTLPLLLGVDPRRAPVASSRTISFVFSVNPARRLADVSQRLGGDRTSLG